ncbi:MAG: hypothetical protein IPP48_15115 [Chitinophagaceae bacterium]|nr:hypothetical protein [Chitinophagaceae bacterium]
MKKIYLLLIAIITFAISGFAQITVTGGTGAAGTYTTLGGAIVAINGGGALTAPVVVDVVAGHKDTLTGSILLTMTGTAANTITIQKVGQGLIQL